MTEKLDLSKLKTVKQLVEEWPWVNEKGLRDYLSRAEKNKTPFRRCVFRLGTKILVDPEVFMKQFLSENGMGQSMDIR